MSAPTASRNPAAPDNFEPERAAVERLLASGIFDRSPSLAIFLRYICGKYFENKADDIKEYSIAVEALGRHPDFDQKRDAIVRVEAHRLRKRLQQYYEGKGSAEPIQIVIPPGSYAPQFHLRIAQSKLIDRTRPEETESLTLDMAPPTYKPVRKWPLYLIAILFIAVASGAILRWRSNQNEQITDKPAITSLAVPAALEEVRLLAGSTVSRYVDHEGNTWSGDRYFKGGISASVNSRPILRTLDPAMYLTRREGDFKYDVPLKLGIYELRLHFAETIFGENNIAGGGEASRIFTVRMNGLIILRETDILADAGGSNTANIKVYKDVSPAADGYLHLEFLPNYKEVAFVNAIEIVPGMPQRMRPVRIIARPSAYTASDRAEWQPDEFYTGGQFVQRHDKVSNTTDQEIYQSERYGNFTYTVPVVDNSRYTATFRFCEHWFGPGRPGGGGIGSRVFDVYMNGRMLLEGFDIFKEAGGSLNPINKTFRYLQPNAQGKLVFQFVPVRNYALLNGIEVTEESR
jgi:malectin (di-glucose binding ER protein)